MMNATGSNSCLLLCENSSTAFPYHLLPEGTTTVPQQDVVRLQFLTDPWGSWINEIAREFEAYKNGTVQIQVMERPYDQVRDDILNEAVSQVGLLDGFITGPSVSGSVVAHEGWADLRPFLWETTERMQDWTDILLGYRKYIAQYQDQIIMYPLDGDLLAMYYRKDILRHFDLPIPRTWDEYSYVAQQVHGQVYDNQTLVGSCVGRGHQFCGNSYWANLMLSQMTQTEGPWQGHSFDTKDMTPLTGPALEQVYKWMEEQVQYGAPDGTCYCIVMYCIVLYWECMHEVICRFLHFIWNLLFQQLFFLFLHRVGLLHRVEHRLYEFWAMRAEYVPYLNTTFL